MLEEKEIQKILEKLPLVTKDGKKYRSVVQWEEKYPKDLIKEGKGYRDEQLKDMIEALEELMPYAKRRRDEIYEKIKEAEEKGYIPRTLREIEENYKKYERIYEEYQKDPDFSRAEFNLNEMFRFYGLYAYAIKQAMKKV